MVDAFNDSKSKDTMFYMHLVMIKLSVVKIKIQQFALTIKHKERIVPTLKMLASMMNEEHKDRNVPTLIMLVSMMKEEQKHNTNLV